MRAFSIQEKTDLLRHITIFSETDEHILTELAGVLSEKEALKGSVIVRKGDVGDALFVIARGSVRIHDGNHVLARMEQGGVFGEYALLDDNTRSASVTAEENCLLLRLDRTDFYRIALQNAEILQGALRALIHRMREMNELEEKLSKSYLKIRKQKEQIEKQNISITEQKELLSQQNFDLTKLNEEKNQFLGMVIHQIKNPLTSSLCMLEMLDADSEHLTEVQKEGIGIIIKSLWRINQLINQTLDVASIESKVFEVKLEPLDLHTIVYDLLDNYSYLISQKEIHVDSEIVEIRANLNRVYFAQIVDNLLSNAFKFTPPGKNVRVILIKEEGEVVLRVQDEGPGITEDLIGRIFHQYNRQTDMNTQALPPLGLGLAIVHKYAMAMNGTVSCENCPNGGTCFTVKFPVW
jgi:two-component system, sensor histidine kinase and response regulator